VIRTPRRKYGRMIKPLPVVKPEEVPLLQGRQAVPDSQAGDGFSPLTRHVAHHRRSIRMDQPRGRESSRSNVNRNSRTSRILKSGSNSDRNSSSLTTGGPLAVGSFAFPARVSHREPGRVTRLSIFRKPERFRARMPW